MEWRRRGLNLEYFEVHWNVLDLGLHREHNLISRLFTSYSWFLHGGKDELVSVHEGASWDVKWRLCDED